MTPKNIFIVINADVFLEQICLSRWQTWKSCVWSILMLAVPLNIYWTIFRDMFFAFHLRLRFRRLTSCSSFRKPNRIFLQFFSYHFMTSLNMNMNTKRFNLNRLGKQNIWRTWLFSHNERVKKELCSEKMEKKIITHYCVFTYRLLYEPKHLFLLCIYK